MLVCSDIPMVNQMLLDENKDVCMYVCVCAFDSRCL